METMAVRTTDAHQRTWLTAGCAWRNAVEGSDSSVFHSIAWVLMPRHIPNALIGNRRRNGHCSSSGSTATSVDRRVSSSGPSRAAK